MKRRAIITLPGAAALSTAWPAAARAQQPATPQPTMPVIGFMHSGSPEPAAPLVAAFHKGLKEAGFTDGQDVKTEYRWAEGQDGKLPAFADELVRLRVAVITGLNSTAAVRAARAMTTTIPLVFAIGADPVKVGLVASLNRPGGNITGVSFLANLLVQKRLELLSELVPKSATIGMLVNPNNPNAPSDTREVQAAAAALGLKLRLVHAGSTSDFEPAFAIFAREHIAGLFVNVDALFTANPGQLVALAAKHAFPAIYDRREFVAAGGLIAYGPDLAAVYHEVGIYTGRILKGASPAELPVLQPTKFELVINLKTAKALDIAIPPAILARADDVIE
jgi:putative ABC transport system substrate-binding protein